MVRMRVIFSVLSSAVLLAAPLGAAVRVRPYAGASAGYSMLGWSEFELESDTAILALGPSDLPKRAASYHLFSGLNFESYGLELFLKQSFPVSGAAAKYRAASVGLDALGYLYRDSNIEIFAGFRVATVFTDISAESVGALGAAGSWKAHSEGVGAGFGGGALYHMGRFSLRFSFWSMDREGLGAPREMEASAAVMYWF